MPLVLQVTATGAPTSSAEPQNYKPSNQSVRTIIGPISKRLVRICWGRQAGTACSGVSGNPSFVAPPQQTWGSTQNPATAAPQHSLFASGLDVIQPAKKLPPCTRLHLEPAILKQGSPVAIRQLRSKLSSSPYSCISPAVQLSETASPLPLSLLHPSHDPNHGTALSTPPPSERASLDATSFARACSQAIIVAIDETCRRQMKTMPRMNGKESFANSSCFLPG